MRAADAGSRNLRIHDFAEKMRATSPGKLPRAGNFPGTGTCQHFGRLWLSSAQVGPMLLEFGNMLATIGKHRPKVGHFRPKLTMSEQPPPISVARSLALSRCVFLPALTTADDPHAHDCIVHQLAVRGFQAMQAAMYTDATLWALNTARHGATHSATSPRVARARDLRRRHTSIREAVAGPLWL